MTKYCLLVLICIILTGCGSTQTFETLGDIDIAPVIRQERKVILDVPDDAEIISASTGTLYLCDDYTVSVDVLHSGDLNATMEELTGFGSVRLTVIETAAGDLMRYELAWSSAGENGDTVCRAVIYDDGIYHYCLTLQTSAWANDAQKEWQAILDSFQIV